LTLFALDVFDDTPRRFERFRKKAVTSEPLGGNLHFKHSEIHKVLQQQTNNRVVSAGSISLLLAYVPVRARAPAS
jgi:hypothetical protein